MISYSRIRDRWLHRVRDQLRDQSIRGESARGLRAVYYRRDGKYCRWSRLPDRQAITFHNNNVPPVWLCDPHSQCFGKNLLIPLLHNRDYMCLRDIPKWQQRYNFTNCIYWSCDFVQTFCEIYVFYKLWMFGVKKLFRICMYVWHVWYWCLIP